jgi:hypothetical protein
MCYICEPRQMQTDRRSHLKKSYYSCLAARSRKVSFRKRLTNPFIYCLLVALPPPYKQAHTEHTEEVVSDRSKKKRHRLTSQAVAEFQPLFPCAFFASPAEISRGAPYEATRMLLVLVLARAAGNVSTSATSRPALFMPASKAHRTTHTEPRPPTTPCASLLLAHDDEHDEHNWVAETEREVHTPTQTLLTPASSSPTHAHPPHHHRRTKSSNKQETIKILSTTEGVKDEDLLRLHRPPPAGRRG